MDQIITGVVVVGVGIAIIAFRRKFIEEVINNEGFGFYKYDDRERKVMRRTVPLFGVFAIILGILILTGIFELK